MTADELSGQLQRGRERVEFLLKDRLDRLKAQTPPRLHEAMAYSLLAGGKRLRPLLCLAFAEAAGQPGGALVEDCACALEYVHTYSLIHDDLPAMDDDELRRGRPTNHKVFGEAMAILAGDALLTEAFALLSQGHGPRATLVTELSQAAGATGMVGGQVLDVAEDRPAEEAYLLKLHRLKTGALIRAACRMGVLAAGNQGDLLLAADRYGEAVGLAFQIADDNLDVTATSQNLGKPVGADARAGRVTFPGLLGLPRSQALANEWMDRAIEALRAFGPKGDLLKALARYAVERSG